MNDKQTGAGKAHTNGDPAQAEQAEQAKEAKSGASKPGGSRAEERIAALDTSGAAQAAQLEQLRVELEVVERRAAVAEQRAAEAEAGWQRARADYANLKRRGDEERADLAGRASDRLLVRVLDLADDFDLAVEHVPDDAKGSPWLEGITAIDRKLRALLEAEGIEAMGGEGAPFDPQTQQAISYEDSPELPDGTVVKILQRGYTIRGRVLRPALVAVARNEPPAAGDEPDPDTTTDDDASGDD